MLMFTDIHHIVSLLQNIIDHTFPLRLISPVIFYNNTCHRYPSHSLVTTNITCHTFLLRLIYPVLFYYIACYHDHIVQSAILCSFIDIILQYNTCLCSSREANVSLILYVSLLFINLIPFIISSASVHIVAIIMAWHYHVQRILFSLS